MIIEKNSLKIHLNQNKNLQGNLGVLLILLESPWWVAFNECDLDIFGLETFGHIEFWLVFVLGKFNLITKMVLIGKIS